MSPGFRGRATISCLGHELIPKQYAFECYKTASKITNFNSFPSSKAWFLYGLERNTFIALNKYRSSQLVYIVFRRLSTIKSSTFLLGYCGSFMRAIKTSERYDTSRNCTFKDWNLLYLNVQQGYVAVFGSKPNEIAKHCTQDQRLVIISSAHRCVCPNHHCRGREKVSKDSGMQQGRLSNNTAGTRNSVDCH
jgi:hypothetical protein